MGLLKSVILIFSASPLFAELSLLNINPLHQITVGSVCEDLALQEYAAYREKHVHVLQNVVYTIGNYSRDTIGELDVVVLKRDTIREVIEVKCGQNPEEAMSRAQDQMQRFFEVCGWNRCHFWKDGIQILIRTPEMMEQIEFTFVSYKGAGNGFDELDESYEDIARFVYNLL